MKLVPFKNRNNMMPIMSLFDDFGNTFNEIQERESKYMALDIEENDENYIVKANMPGFKKEDVNISVDENELKIQASYEENKEDQSKNYIRKERYSGSYQRNLKLSDNCDVENINAKMEDGVLIVNIPKIEPKPKKEIVIN